jgi:hypothetical protein
LCFYRAYAVLSQRSDRVDPNPGARMRFLRDPIWQFVGALLAVVAVAIAVVSIVLNLPKKQLDVVLVSTIPLVSVSGEASGDVEVYYRGSKATNVYLSQVKVLNSGNQPITEDDFSKPVSFSFSPNQVAEASIIGSAPESLPITLTQSAPHEVQMNPALLNPGDSATIRFIVLGNSSGFSEPKISGRIVGVRQIGVSRPTNSPSWTEGVLRWILISLGIVSIFLILLWLLRLLFGSPPARMVPP